MTGTAARPIAALLPRSAYGFAALLALALVAFWPTYFSRLAQADRYTHFHAGCMLVWMGLLLVQAGLVRRGQRATHRLLGRTAYVVGPVVALSILLLAHHRIASGGTAPTPEQAGLLFVQLGTLLVFAASLALALWHRRQPPEHARYMVGTALTLVDPAVARVFAFHLPFPGAVEYGGIVIVLGLLGVLIAVERRQGRRWRAFPVLAGLFVLYQIGVLSVAGSAWWAACAARFARWPLT